MGNFEDAIPKTLTELEGLLGKQRRDLWSFERQFNHDCDCEYCDVDPETPDAEQQEQIDDMEADIAETRVTIRRLKDHAKVHGIEVKS